MICVIAYTLAAERPAFITRQPDWLLKERKAEAKRSSRLRTPWAYALSVRSASHAYALNARVGAGTFLSGTDNPAITPAITALLLCVGYVLNLCLTNVAREQAGGVDTVWTANAFVIGAMLLLPQRWTPACLTAGFFIQAAIVLAFAHSALDAFGYSLLNTIEALVVVTLARRLNAARLTTPGRFVRLIFLALLPMLVVGTFIVGLVVLGLNGEFPTAMVLGRLAAKFLGMSIVLPALLLLGQSTAAAQPGWKAAASVVAAGGLAALPYFALVSCRSSPCSL